MFKSSNAAANTKLLGFPVQTSVAGKGIPIVYGTTRIAGNVVWTGDWRADPISNKSKAGGGKGGAGQQYDYHTALIIALCQGPILAINQIWLDQIQLDVAQTTETFVGPGTTVTATFGDAFLHDVGVYVPTPYNTPINDFGSPGPSVINGEQQVPLTQGTGGVFSVTVLHAGTGYTSPPAVVFVPVDGKGSGAAATAQISGGSITGFTVTAAGSGYTTEPDVQLVGGGGTGAQAEAQLLPPGAGSYYVNTKNGTYTFNITDGGATVVITYRWLAVSGQPVPGNPPSAILNMSLVTGKVAQEPIDYLTTKHPSQAIGYTEVALLFSPDYNLGVSGILSNISVEVLGQQIFGGGFLDATIDATLYDILTNPLWGAGFPGTEIGDLTEIQTYCLAHSLFASIAVEAQQSASSYIRELLLIANAEAVWSEGLLKFRCYGDTSAVGNGATFTPNTRPIYDLDDDDFQGPVGTPPFTVERPSVKDAKNSITVEWRNRLNSYNPEPLYESDPWSIQNYGIRPESSLTLHSITMQSVAQQVAITQLQRSVYIRNKYKFKLPWNYLLLEPMDLVTVTDPYLGLITYPVRIVSIQEDDTGCFDIEAEDFPWGTASPTLNPKQVTSTFGPGFFDDPGPVHTPIFWEPTIEQSKGIDYQLFIGLSGGTAWGGCTVWVSDDSNTYHQVGRQNGPSTEGFLTNDLADGTTVDDVNTLSVDLTESNGVLDSFTRAQENLFIPLCLVDQELMAYRTATLTGPFAYDITHLRRGVYDTPIQTHRDGTSFMFFDAGLFIWTYDVSDVQKLRYFKFTSFNRAQQREQTLDQVVAYPYYIRNPRSPFPWCAAETYSNLIPNDPISNRAFPSIQQYMAGNSALPQFLIIGKDIFNHFTTKTVPPNISFANLISGTGNLKEGDNIVISACSVGPDGLLTDFTTVVEYTIPVGSGLHNSVRFNISFAGASDSGLIFGAMGDTERGLTIQSTVGAGETSFIVPSINAIGFGIPDQRFHHFKVQAKWDVHAGVWGGHPIAVGPYTLDFAPDAAWVPNQLVGRPISLVSKKDLSTLPVVTANITSNSATQLTLDVDLSSLMSAGDDIVIRSIATDCTAYKVTDDAWINGGPGQPGTGLTPSAEKGNLLWVIAGTGANQVIPILDNDETSVTLASPLETLLDRTSICIIVEHNWTTLMEGQAQDVAKLFSTVLYAPAITNAGQSYVVQVLTVDKFGNTSDPLLSPFREIFFIGGDQPLSAAPFTVTAEGYAMLTINDVSLEQTQGIGAIKELDFCFPSADETDLLFGIGDIDADIDPAVVPLDGFVNMSRLGTTLQVGDFIIWNDPYHYEINQVTEISNPDALKPWDDQTQSWDSSTFTITPTITLKRNPDGNLTSHDAWFGTKKAQHVNKTFFRLIPMKKTASVRQDSFATTVPATTSGINEKWEWAWANKAVAAVISQALGDLGQGPIYTLPLVPVSATTDLPAPGLRTLNGAQYDIPFAPGDLFVGQTAAERIRVTSWSSIRNVNLTLRSAPAGGSGVGVRMRVVYITPDLAEAYLVDTCLVQYGALQSYDPATQLPEKRQMPFHDEWPGVNVGAPLPDWPPNLFPKILDPFDGDGNLVLTGGTLAFDTSTFRQLEPGGYFDAIVETVGTDPANPGGGAAPTVQT